MTWRR